MHVRKFFTAAVLAALSVPAFAEPTHWYAGISAGQSRTSDELVHNRESTIVAGPDARIAVDKHLNLIIEIN